MNSSLEAAMAARVSARAIFSKLVPIVGLGITKIGDGYGIKVNLREQPASNVYLPRDIEGVPVRFEVIGPLRSL